MNEVKSDYVGSVFAPREHQIPTASACRLSNTTRYNRFVGVFVNEQPVIVARIAKQTGLDVIQLHGDESDAGIWQLRESCNCEIWKALRIGQIEDMDAAAFPYADHLFVDNYVQGLRGEGGKRVAMGLLQKLDVPRLIIAGRTCRDNAKEILALQPYGIDASSALETNGKKDEEKVRTLMKWLKG